jgi:hypothetical protein
MFFAKVPHCFIDDLPTDRPFTRLEAVFMYEVDRFNSKERTKREYAKTWSWSPGKVIRFITEIGNTDSEESLSISIKTDGTATEQSRNTDGTAKELKNSRLQGVMEQRRNSDGTEPEHVFIKREKREESLSLFDLWNQVVEGTPLPSARSFSGERQKKCKARIKERSLQEWGEVFRLMIVTPFLCGQNDRGWKADFDWITANDANAGKILEGKYKNAGGRAVTSDNRYAMFAGA